MSYFITLLNRLVRDCQFAHVDHVRILMIKACQNEDELKQAMSYFREISGSGFEFTLYSFNTIQLGRFDMIGVAQMFILKY